MSIREILETHKKVRESMEQVEKEMDILEMEKAKIIVDTKIKNASEYEIKHDYYHLKKEQCTNYTETYVKLLGLRMNSIMFSDGSCSFSSRDYSSWY